MAKSGAGRVVLVSGEPGIGKSRLTAALSQRLETEPHTRLRYFCSPHHQDSALYPFIGQLERAAGFARDDTTATKLDKLEALLGDGAEPGDLSLIAETLSLSGGEHFSGERTACDAKIGAFGKNYPGGFLKPRISAAFRISRR